MEYIGIEGTIEPQDPLLAELADRILHVRHGQAVVSCIQGLSAALSGSFPHDNPHSYSLKT